MQSRKVFLCLNILHKNSGTQAHLHKLLSYKCHGDFKRVLLLMPLTAQLTFRAAVGRAKSTLSGRRQLFVQSSSNKWQNEIQATCCFNAAKETSCVLMCSVTVVEINCRKLDWFIILRNSKGFKRLILLHCKLDQYVTEKLNEGIPYHVLYLFHC